MCGIAGKLSPWAVEADALERMADAIRHRGPDDSGYYLNGGVGLANRRLSIIDLDGGKQPISNEDGSLWIVFNGEIYNFPELRQRLIDRGHRFRTRTDTEVIIHLYEDHGPECVKMLRGMFAFAVWDENTKQLVLARDPLGQKPLYYVHKDGFLLFGSEIKAILQDERVTAQMNPNALHHYISLRYVPETETLFKDVNKLPAGHYLVARNGNVETHRYWDLTYTPKRRGTEKSLVRELRQLMLDTVSSHLLSDVPVGAFLSGGIDSSLVTAMMSTVSPAKIQTFSIGVKEDDFNELPYARMVAERYGTIHHEYIAEPDLVASLPEMLWHVEEPVDPFAFGVYTVAKLASQHVKVVMGGDGGDEMFAGYDRYLGNELIDLYTMLPAPLRRHAIEPIIRRLPDNFSYNNRVQKLRWMVAMAGESGAMRYARSASFLRFSYEHKQALYTDKMWSQVGEPDSTQQLVRLFEADNASEAVDRMLYTDVKTRLSDHLLMVVDRMTMAHSLEGRSPFVDQEVATFAASLPADLKLNGRRLKYIEREVAREFLPAELITRRKQGFGFPLAYWFSNSLRGLTLDLFGNSNLVAEGYFQAEALQQLLSEHVEGKVDNNYRLWLLLNLELWHRLFIEGRSRDEMGDYLRRTVDLESTPRVTAGRKTGSELNAA